MGYSIVRKTDSRLGKGRIQELEEDGDQQTSAAAM